MELLVMFKYLTIKAFFFLFGICVFCLFQYFCFFFFVGIITHKHGGITVTVTLSIKELLILLVSRQTLVFLSSHCLKTFQLFLNLTFFFLLFSLSNPLFPSPHPLLLSLNHSLFEVTISLFSSCVFDLFLYFPSSFLITFNVHETLIFQLPSTVLLCLDLPQSIHMALQHP